MSVSRLAAWFGGCLLLLLVVLWVMRPSDAQQVAACLERLGTGVTTWDAGLIMAQVAADYDVAALWSKHMSTIAALAAASATTPRDQLASALGRYCFSQRQTGATITWQAEASDVKAQDDGTVTAVLSITVSGRHRASVDDVLFTFVRRGLLWPELAILRHGPITITR